MPPQFNPLTTDPRERIERERRRIERMADPQSYMPGGHQRLGRRRRSQNLELDEETRQGLLSSIGENTMGALYQFANVLDLPGSSVRDIASTVTGTPRNPFDQWLSPTTERGRIRGRELNRQWGLAGPQDNWKNLIGGMGTEIALDPLTYLGFGAGALTKHGQLLKRAGLLDQLPSYRYWRGAERAGKAGEKLSTMGKREALQEITNAEDLIKYMGRGAGKAGDPIMQQRARDALEQTTKSLGYGDYADFLRREGQGALSGTTRFGLPNWRIFGAKPEAMLRQAPGKILGRPGSEGAKRTARTLDEAFRAVSESMPFRHARPLLDTRMASMTSPIGQRAAPAYTAGSDIAETAAGKMSHDTVMDFERVFGKEWEYLLSGLKDNEALKVHDRFRSFFEVSNKAATPQQRAAVDNVIQGIGTQFGRAKERGVVMELLDDDSIQFFPRELTKGLDSGWVDMLRELEPTSPQSLPTSAFSQHQLARIGPLRDIKEGSETINKMWTDTKAVEIKNMDIPDDEKIQQLTRHFSDTYGQGAKEPLVPDQYRGLTINRANIESLPPARRQELRGLQAEVYQHGKFQDIYDNPALDEVTKKRMIDERLREIGVRTDTNYLRDPNVATEITADTRLWEQRSGRHKVLAEMFLRSPEQAHTKGLFGNIPLYDFQNYAQRMEDSINRADFTYSMLAHPHALREAAAGDVGGESLTKVLRDLSMDPDTVLPKLAEERGLVKGQMTDEAYQQALQRFGKKTVEMGVNRDLKRYKQLFEGPEAANFVANIFDNMQRVFKAGVTSPWPAFHGRNLVTGQLREMIQGRWSAKDFSDTVRALSGREIQGASEIPFVKQRWADMQKRIPGLEGAELTNTEANKIIRHAMGESNLVGPYELREGVDAVAGTRHMGAELSEEIPSGAGRAEGLVAETPASYGFSVPHALRTYAGMGHKFKRAVPEGGFKTIKAAPTTTGPIPQITPFPHVDMPFWLGRKGIAKGYRGLRGEEALRQSPRMSKWADEPFLRQPKEWKVPGAEESLGLKGREGQVFSEMPGQQMYGPVAGGSEIAYAAEFMNRVEPWLHMVRRGWDPQVAAREIGGRYGSQISYAAKHYTPFEKQWMKRAVPFWSFTSRSVPWAARKFYEEPHNPLAQIIRGVKRSGEQLQEKHQEVGPVPAHLRDTLAIPLESGIPGTKRFFTGMDVMSQDLWQLLMPILSGQPEEALYEMASRADPVKVKFPIESITGTSLWQRGVEEGRPIRQMSPTIGRTLANIGQTFEKLTGEEYSPDYYERMGSPGIWDRIASSSPYARALSTARTLFDVRKGPGAKALRLGLGAGITDVSPRQQQAILREYLRSMIGEAGGSSFEKATFSKQDLRQMEPQEQKRALQLKALNDEMADVAKELRERARMGMPGY